MNLLRAPIKIYSFDDIFDIIYCVRHDKTRKYHVMKL